MIIIPRLAKSFTRPIAHSLVLSIPTSGHPTMEEQSSHLQILPPCDCVILFAAQINLALLVKDTVTMMTNARELGNASITIAKSKFQVALVLVLQ